MGDKGNCAWSQPAGDVAVGCQHPRCLKREGDNSGVILLGHRELGENGDGVLVEAAGQGWEEPPGIPVNTQTMEHEHGQASGPPRTQQLDGERLAGRFQFNCRGVLHDSHHNTASDGSPGCRQSWARRPESAKMAMSVSSGVSRASVVGRVQGESWPFSPMRHNSPSALVWWA